MKHIEEILKQLKPYVKDARKIEKKYGDKIPADEFFELYTKHFGRKVAYHQLKYFHEFMGYERWKSQGRRYYRRAKEKPRTP